MADAVHSFSRRLGRTAEQLAGRLGMTVAHKCYCHAVTDEDVCTLENLSISLAQGTS